MGSSSGPSLVRTYRRRVLLVAVLPRVKFGAYPQMPYEAVTEEVFREYVRMKCGLPSSSLCSMFKFVVQVARIRPSWARTGGLSAGFGGTDPAADRFCDNTRCEL